MTWVVGITVAALIALGAPIFVALLSAAALALLLFPGPPLIAINSPAKTKNGTDRSA